MIPLTDKSASFFVGDAAGRLNDHSSSDRKWALNIGIPFFTPEVLYIITHLNRCAVHSTIPRSIF